MARDRRTRRTRRGGTEASAPSQPNVFSRLTPDIIEAPARAVVGGAAGLVGNLAGDIRDAVVGLPVGIIKTVEDPVESAKSIAGATWHTWSPLFTGKPGKFLQQVYDHPLAPILDVATVFSLGAGAAARGAVALERAGSTSSTVAKLAKLTQPGVQRLYDPAGVRLPVDKVLSQRAGRRLVQEALIHYDYRLPKFYTRGRYERLHRVDLSRRAQTKQYIAHQATKRVNEIEAAVRRGDRNALAQTAADWIEHADPTDALYASTRLQMDAIIQGAYALEDVTELGKRARSNIVAHMHANLLRHNKTYTEAQARALLKGGHNMLVRAPEYMDSRYWAQLDKARAKHAKLTRAYARRRPKLEEEIAKWERVRQDNAELVHSHDKIRAELASANDEMSAMLEIGWRVAGGYRTRAGNVPKKLTGSQEMRYATDAIEDQVTRIKDLEARNEAAYAAKAQHEKALQELSKLRLERDQVEATLQNRWNDLEAMKDRAASSYYVGVADTYDRTVDVVNNFGRYVKADSFSKAAHVIDPATGEKRYFVVPAHDAYNLGWEGGNSLRFLHKLIHKPTMFWKSAVIGWTPRTITNNAIGNWFLYAVRELPSTHGIQAVGDALRFRFGSKIDGEILFPRNHWLYRYFSDEMSDTFGIGTELVRVGEEASTVGRLKTGPFYPVVGGIEKNQRAMTIYSALRSKPEVRAAIAKARKEGYRGGRATDIGIERALRANPGLQPDAALSSRRIMGDYITLSETEKFLRDIIPFYLWNRHILKTTGNMLLEQPGRLAVGARLSDLGIETTEEALGEIPEFMKGAIPLSLLGFGDSPGRANIMLTASLNPFATVGEMAMQADAILTGRKSRPGEAFLGVNPFLTGSIEAATGTSLLTGQRKQNGGGILGEVLSNMAEQLPYSRLADALTTADSTTSPSGYEYLYKKDDLSQLGSIFGVPIRNVSRETAAKLANTRKTKKPAQEGGRERRGA